MLKASAQISRFSLHAKKSIESFHAAQTDKVHCHGRSSVSNSERDVLTPCQLHLEHHGDKLAFRGHSLETETRILNACVYTALQILQATRSMKDFKDHITYPRALATWKFRLLKNPDGSKFLYNSRRSKLRTPGASGKGQVHEAISFTLAHVRGIQHLRLVRENHAP